MNISGAMSQQREPRRWPKDQHGKPIEGLLYVTQDAYTQVTGEERDRHSLRRRVEFRPGRLAGAPTSSGAPVMNDVWTPVPLEDMAKWRARANEFAVRRLEGQVRCPLCEQSDLRIAFSLHSLRPPRKVGDLTLIGSGPYWEWCDGCHHYAYYPDSEVPDWAEEVCVRETTGTRDPSTVVRLLSER